MEYWDRYNSGGATFKDCPAFARQSWQLVRIFDRVRHQSLY